jgi:hypothetical protein
VPAVDRVPACVRVLLSAVLEAGTMYPENRGTVDLETSSVHLQSSSSGQYTLRRRSSATLCIERYVPKGKAILMHARQTAETVWFALPA